MPDKFLTRDEVILGFDIPEFRGMIEAAAERAKTTKKESISVSCLSGDLMPVLFKRSDLLNGGAEKMLEDLAAIEEQVRARAGSGRGAGTMTSGVLCSQQVGYRLPRSCTVPDVLTGWIYFLLEWDAPRNSLRLRAWQGNSELSIERLICPYTETLDDLLEALEGAEKAIIAQIQTSNPHSAAECATVRQ